MKPKVLHVATVAYALRFMTGFPRFVTSRGGSIFLCASASDDLRELGEAESCRVFGVPISRKIDPLRDIYAILVLCRVISQVRPDVIHLHTPKAGLLGGIAAKIANVPVRVYHIHGLPFVTARGLSRLLLLLGERIACCCASRVLAVGHGVRRVAGAHDVFPSSKIVVPVRGTANGIDGEARFNPERVSWSEARKLTNSLGIPESAKIVGFLGRLAVDKGLRELSEAWSIILEKDPSVHLVIVGDIDSRAGVAKDIYDTLSALPRCHLIGFQKQPEIVYKAISVLAFPSYREGFPYVPMEAAAMGVPCVAANVPGTDEAVVDGITGKLVPVHDSSALAEGILQYLRDEDRRLRHGAAARARVVKGFCQREIWEFLWRDYTALISNTGITVQV